MKNIYFSVIIPVREIGYYLIFENLPELEKQKENNFEVIVLPNQHSQYDLELLKKYKWLRIIPTGKVTRPGEKRDIGAKQAMGTVIAFIDDDAYPSEYWLKKAKEIFSKKKIEAICGPGILPKSASLWEKIFDEILKTFIGSGNYSYRFAKLKERYVDDYPSMNFLIKKNVFNKLGGFHSEYWPGEDSKLCEDLVYKYENKIFYSPEIFIYHHRRKDLKGFLEQHVNYGFHRGAFFAHGDRNSRKISYFIPTLFTLYILFILLFSFYSKYQISNIKYQIFYFPFLIYFLLLISLFFQSFLNTKNFIISLFSPFVLFLTHLVYGIMFLKGFIKGKKNKDKIYS